MRWGYFFILLYCLINPLHAEPVHTTYSFNSSSEAKRFRDLTKEIRCVVCQNQSIADSNAPLAHDLQKKIYEMVTAQQSNEVIKKYLVKRYGEFILLKPRFNKLTLLLWVFPFFALIFVFLGLLSFVKKSACIKV